MKVQIKKPPNEDRCTRCGSRTPFMQIAYGVLEVRRDPKLRNPTARREEWAAEMFVPKRTVLHLCQECGEELMPVVVEDLKAQRARALQESQAQAGG